MKKVLICLLTMLALIALGEPHVRQYALHAAGSLLPTRQPAAPEAEIPSFSKQVGSQRRRELIDVTLYFRYGDTQLLGAQQAQLDIRREETVATSIVQRLIDGPAVSHDRLTALFPQGTRLISVSGEDTTAFVTLSLDFLGSPDGAPADWEDLTVWQEEAALRRRLAVQSIVLALTENGRYQRVQMYVADGDDEIPQRIPMAYFDLSAADSMTVLAACARDEALLLTPGIAAQLFLQGWQDQDYAAMHALLAPAQDGEQLTFSAFEAIMKERAIHLLSFNASAGTVSIDGQRATVIVDAKIRSVEGGDAQIVRQSIPLLRVQDNWAIEMDTLDDLMIRD